MSPGFEKTNSKKGLPLAQPDASPIRPARHVGLAHFKVLRPDRVLDSNEEESLVKQPLKAKENPYIEKLAGTKKDECQDAQDNIGSSANPKEIIQVASIFGDLKVKPKYVSGHIAFMVTKDEKDFLSVLVPEIKLAVSSVIFSATPRALLIPLLGFQVSRPRCRNVPWFDLETLLEIL